MRKILVFLLLFFGAITKVNAQVVIDTVRFEQEIQDLTAEYKDTLRTYEKESNEFSFAKLQHEKLQTLASLEEAILENRELFVVRDELLLRYAKLLRLKLYTSFGIFLDTKQEKILALDALIKNLEEHLEMAKKIEDRDDVIASTLEFSNIGTALQIESEQITPLFSLGKLQSTFDKTAVLIDRVESHVLESKLSAAQRAEKKRGLELIRERENEMRAVLKELNGPIILDRRGNVVKSKIDSNTVYAGISQVLSYLEEILAN